MMKKTILTIAMAALFLSGTTAYAETPMSTVSVNQLILQLQQQIVDLKAKIVALQSAQTAANTSGQNVQSTLQLIGALQLGMSGDQVKLLQTVLASESDVYPEQVITGYYGKLTEKAIRRFQKKHGLSETGGVGSTTIVQLNKILKLTPIHREDDDEDDDHDKNDKGGKHGVRFCLGVPPGHLIAPGWLKHNREGNNKHDDDYLLIARCKKLPHFSTTTPPIATTTDVVAPIISALSVINISATGANLTWTSNESATSKVWIGTTSPLVTTGTPTVVDGTLLTAHTAVFSGLTPSTTYFFVIKNSDATGNTITSAQGSFVTSIALDVTAPVISGFSAAPTASTTGVVSWTTNEQATSKVYFSTTTPVNTASAFFVTDAALLTAHSLSLTGLTASTTYYVVAESRDAANNLATSSQTSFTTSL